MKCYRVWFAWGDDSATNFRCYLVDANNQDAAVKFVADQLAQENDPDGFIIGKVECLDGQEWKPAKLG